MSDDPPSKNPAIDAQLRGDSREPTESKDAQDPEAKQKKLQALLAGLWEQSRQTITERIETLQEAKSLAAAGKLDEPARLRAVDSAHKLAGVLGTFGLPHGTELAREAEEVFERHAIVGPAVHAELEHPELEHLGALLDDLASLIRAAGSTLKE